jgi:hypothetical protein
MSSLTNGYTLSGDIMGLLKDYENSQNTSSLNNKLQNLADNRYANNVASSGDLFPLKDNYGNERKDDNGNTILCPKRSFIKDCECKNGNCVFPWIGTSCDFHEDCPYKPSACNNCGLTTTRAPTSNANNNTANNNANNTANNTANNSNSSNGAGSSGDNYSYLNIPDEILNDPELLQDYLEYMKAYLEAQGINVSSSTYQATTTNDETDNVYNSSPNTYASSSSNIDMSQILQGASMRDIKILLALIMNMDLDKDGYPDIFAMIKNMKTSLMNSNEYDNESQLQNDLYNYRNQYPSSNFMEKLFKKDQEMFRKLFGDKKAYEYSTVYIPGFQYTPPKLWPQQSYRPPVCIPDRQKVGNPAFVFGSGTPVNALDYEALRILPEFRYFESNSDQDDQYMANQRRADNLCSMYCRNKCELPLCSALNCPSCRQ